MTKFNFGIIGQNIAYSQSPEIFNAIFGLRQIEGEFTVYDFPISEFDKHLPVLRKLDGFSVTIPFKDRIIDFIAEMGNSTHSIQAVNSVKVEKSRFFGFNTDGIGFIYGLCNPEIKLKNALIIGYGGAARAVIHALIGNFKIKNITVCGRKILDTCLLRQKYFSHIASDIGFSYSVASQLEYSAEYDLIVNCTPCGDRNHRNESPLTENFEFQGRGIYYDLIYDPSETALMSKAAKSGWYTKNGYPMLVRQAVESYKIWSGDDISADRLTQDVIQFQEKQV
ncbi:MAG: shikimate dehydrogenase [Candidatus Zixiibacteriota bacterium]